MHFGKGLELMSQDLFEELRKDCAMMRQGLDLPVITVFGGTSIVTTPGDSGLFYSHIVEQQ